MKIIAQSDEGTTRDNRRWLVEMTGEDLGYLSDIYRQVPVEIAIGKEYDLRLLYSDAQKAMRVLDAVSAGAEALGELMKKPEAM